jgi:hypothetical protein
MTVCGFHVGSCGAEITASECISTDLSLAPGDTRAGKDRNFFLRVHDRFCLNRCGPWPF